MMNGHEISSYSDLADVQLRIRGRPRCFIDLSEQGRVLDTNEFLYFGQTLLSLLHLFLKLSVSVAHFLL